MARTRNMAPIQSIYGAAKAKKRIIGSVDAMERMNGTAEVGRGIERTASALDKQARWMRICFEYGASLVLHDPGGHTKTYEQYRQGDQSLQKSRKP
mmetsp:Transcript_20083/g.55863  ORF Transcript_20083/g.55863 Transcript_20083/m.55863 type:complete len:96 (-) Transcript_20083:1037-1324(-)